MAQSLGTIAPILGAGFAAFLLAGEAGGVGPFVMLLVFAGSLLLGWTVSLYGRRFAGAGGIYEYLVRAHGAEVGVGATLAFYAVNLVFIGGAVYALEGELWKSFATAHLDFDSPWWVAALVTVALGSLATYLGVRLSTRAQLALVSVSTLPFVVLVVAVIASGGDSGNTLSVFDPWNDAGGDIFQGVLFAILLFAGFESAAVLGEESDRPHRSIPRAFVIAVGLSGVFFVAVLYAGTIGFGPEKAAVEWGSNPVGLSTLGDRYVGSPLGALVELAVIVDVLAVAVGGTNAMARGLFALGRDGMLPSVLATRSRHETPLAGILTVAGFGLAGLVVAATFKDRFEYLTLVVIALTLVLVLIYLLLVLGAVRFVIADREALWSLPLIAAAAAVPSLGLYGTLDPFLPGSERWGVGIAAAAVVGAAAWVVALRLRRPDRLQRAGDYALRPGGAST